MAVACVFGQGDGTVALIGKQSVVSRVVGDKPGQEALIRNIDVAIIVLVTILVSNVGDVKHRVVAN